MAMGATESLRINGELIAWLAMSMTWAKFNYAITACTIPLSTRRSSTRGIPPVPVGSSGSIRAYCLSENQKKSTILNASSPSALNHYFATLGILLWVRTLISGSSLTKGRLWRQPKRGLCLAN